jgi:acetyl esterase/lipase
MRRSASLLTLLVLTACGEGHVEEKLVEGYLCPAPRFDAPSAFTLEEDVVYGVVGEQVLLANVYRPEGDGPFPAIVMVHGGGWMSGDRTFLERASEHYAERGFVVMNVEYRLVPGVTMGDQIGDVSCAVRWLRERASEYAIDDQCVGMLGESAGGHLTASVALMGGASRFPNDCDASHATTPLLRFAMPYYGVFDFERFIGTGSALYAFELAFFGAGGTAGIHSPERFVDERLAIDFFVGVGSEDVLVDPVESREFHAALEGAGRRATFVEVEGAEHGFVAGGFDGEHNAVAQPIAEAFLLETLGHAR